MMMMMMTVLLKTAEDGNVAMGLRHLSHSMSVAHMAAFVLLAFILYAWIPALKPQSCIGYCWASSATILGGTRHVF